MAAQCEDMSGADVIFVLYYIKVNSILSLPLAFQRNTEAKWVNYSLHENEFHAMVVQLGITADVSWRLVCLCQMQHWGQEIPANKEEETEKACDCELESAAQPCKTTDWLPRWTPCLTRGEVQQEILEKEKHFEQDMEEMMNWFSKRGLISCELYNDCERQWKA